MSDSIIENCVIIDLPMVFQVYDHDINPHPIDYESYHPKFAWLPTDIIEKTFQKTTQFYRSTPFSNYLKKMYKAPFPALNVHRRNEDVATDYIYCDTPAIDDGSTGAQF